MLWEEVVGLLSLMVPRVKFLAMTVFFNGILTVNGFNFVGPEEGVIHFDSLDTGVPLYFFGQSEIYKIHHTFLYRIKYTNKY